MPYQQYKRPFFTYRAHGNVYPVNGAERCEPIFEISLPVIYRHQHNIAGKHMCVHHKKKKTHRVDVPNEQQTNQAAEIHLKI